MSRVSFGVFTLFAVFNLTLIAGCVSVRTPTTQPTTVAMIATLAPLPTATPTFTDTPTPTLTSSPTNTPTVARTATPRPTDTPKPTATPRVCGLTLPYREGTPYTIGDRFDTLQSSRHHVGTDLHVNKNGIEAVAPEDGRIIWIGPDPNGGWGIDVMTSCNWAYGVFHIAPIPELKEGVYIRRGQYIGTVDFPSAPHIHLDIKLYEKDGLYFVDIYPQSGESCVRWKFGKQGEVTLTYGKCSQGYWLGGSPRYP